MEEITGMGEAAYNSDVIILHGARANSTSQLMKENNYRLKWTGNTDRWGNPLMGWASTRNPLAGNQTKIRFDDLDSAIKYCEQHGLTYHVANETELSREYRGKKYANKFRFKGTTKKGSSDDDDTPTPRIPKERK